MHKVKIRILDFTIALIGIIIAAPIMLIVTLVCVWDTGSPIFFQRRVGKNKKPFTLIKFRTMKTATESVASHLADKNAVTKVGVFLRKSKLDELPQLFNVIMGDMSLVGPRPNLYSQKEVIRARDTYKLYNVIPGITGLSQINGIDMSTPYALAKSDRRMIDQLSVSTYLKLILLTVNGKGKGDAMCKQKQYTVEKASR